MSLLIAGRRKKGIQTPYTPSQQNIASRGGLGLLVKILYVNTRISGESQGTILLCFRPLSKQHTMNQRRSKHLCGRLSWYKRLNVCATLFWRGNQEKLLSILGRSWDIKKRSEERGLEGRKDMKGKTPGSCKNSFCWKLSFGYRTEHVKVWHLACNIYRCLLETKNQALLSSYQQRLENNNGFPFLVVSAASEYSTAPKIQHRWGPTGPPAFWKQQFLPQRC